MKSFRLMGMVFLMVFFVACASRGVVINTVPTEVKLSTYKSIWITVSSEVASEQEMNILADQVIRELGSANKFEKLSGPGEKSEPQDLQLKLVIVDVLRVNPEDRMIAGAMAGKAKILVDGELIDTATGSKVGSFRVEGKSSGGSIFAGDTTQAIVRASEMIVDYILDNY